MKSLVIIFVAAFLFGCSSVKPAVEYRTQTVYVQLPPPELNLPEREPWATEEITEDMPLNEVARRYVIFRHQALTYIQQLENLIKGTQTNE